MIAPFHVLIIDDSPDDRADLRQMLLRGSDRHYRFTEATTGRDALDKVQGMADALPDCVLLDFHLPDMDATEVLAELRGAAELPLFPVILITGSDTVSGPNVLRAGAQDYIGKSWTTPQSLTRTVESAVERFALLSEHLHAKERLRKSEESERAQRGELEALMDAIPAIVLIAHDARCEVITGNRATTEILRLPAGANPFRKPDGKSPPAFKFYSAGRHVPEGELPMQRAATTGQAVAGQEVDIVFPNGDTVNLFGEAHPLFDATGSVRGSVGAFVDITARRETERALVESRERLLRAQRAARVGLWESDLVSGAGSWTDEAWTIYGRQPGDFPITHENWLLCVHPDDRIRTAAAIETSQALGRYHDEFRVIDPDGGVRWVESRGQFIFNDATQPVRMLGTLLDITECKRAEIALSEVALRKDEFLAMLGHELRNPLSAIRHAVQITRETPDDRDACQWADEVVDRQSLQLSRMVEDLLDVARINNGRIELRPESLDLRPVIERAIAAVSALLKERRHVLTVEIEDQLYLKGDAVRLEQIFVNLLNNAAKYTPEGGRIAVQARSKDGEIVVSIADNGVGISGELLPQIFDLFRQADSSLDRAEGGLGIGLSVVKSLVEMHAGRVTIQSAGKNSGSTVTVRLPSLSNLESVAALAAKKAVSSAAPQEIRVLIVDDHIDAAQALARLLSGRSCNVRLAHDGPSGADVARDFRPEVLLLDLGLPGFDGYELARMLRAEAPFSDALFIAISGYAHESDRQLSLAAGFNDHFAKPLDFKALVAAIHARRMVITRHR